MERPCEPACFFFPASVSFFFPSAAGTLNEQQPVAAMPEINLLDWESDPLLAQAAKQLGVLESDLRPKPRDAFMQKGVPSQIVTMRFQHAAERRAELAEQLSQRYDELRRKHEEQLRRQADEQELFGPGGISGGGSTAGPSAQLSSAVAGDARRLELLAKKREEEIEKMIAFQSAQRESEQRHEEARQAELRHAEAKAREAARRTKQKLEEKRKFQEEMHAKELAAEAAAEAKRNSELARERERMRIEAMKAAQAKREARQREEENKAKQARRQQETQALFAAAEARVLERARVAEERKQQKRLLFEAQQREARRLVAERLEKARVRVEAAKEAQSRMADEMRQAYDEREHQMQMRKEKEAYEMAEQRRQQRERQLAMALRRGKIFEKMKTDEEARVYDLVERMGKQEQSMEQMQNQRRLMQMMRDEQKRLRQQDRQMNIERMLRAKEYHNAELKSRFQEEDEKEHQRKAMKHALVEHHRMASLSSTFAKQELVDKLQKAKGKDDLLALMGSGSAHACAAAPSAASTPRSAASTPRSTEIGATPSTAKAHLAEIGRDPSRSAEMVGGESGPAGAGAPHAHAHAHAHARARMHTHACTRTHAHAHAQAQAHTHANAYIHAQGHPPAAAAAAAAAADLTVQPCISTPHTSHLVPPQPLGLKYLTPRTSRLTPHTKPLHTPTSPTGVQSFTADPFTPAGRPMSARPSSQQPLSFAASPALYSQPHPPTSREGVNRGRPSSARARLA